MRDGWVLRYDGVYPAAEPLREVLCSLGNGRFGTRAAAPESRPDGVHYPGTYAAGFFDRLSDVVDGHRVENESMVNLPDWQSLTWRPDGGDWLDLGTVQVAHYVQELDLRRGVLHRRFVVEDSGGRRSRVAERRFVSMADPYLAGLECTVVPENWGGLLTVRSGLDGRVSNAGVARYRDFSRRHLTGIDPGDDGELLVLTADTVQSHLRVALAARHRVLVDGCPVPGSRTRVAEDELAAWDFTVDAAPGRAVTVEKVVALCTSLDRAIGEPTEAARQRARRAPDLDTVLARHTLAWDHLWQRSDVHVDGPEHTTRVLRLHLFHLLQTLSPLTAELDVGVPARGLAGEAYRGHVFWDEVFVLPFLSLRMPAVARSALMYRWRRLPEARAAATSCGHRGAMYPWQSGATGREESQTVHLNPSSGHWLPDNSALQRHIGLAIAHNTWRYVEATGDLEFLGRHGAEMVLEIAAFFADLATYDRSGDRYDICGVMGPDEYHDRLPGRETPGLDDNAYTNVMAAWTLQRGLDVLELLPRRRREELLEDLELTRPDLDRWEHVSRRLRLCWHADGVLSQFRGYEGLAEFDWAGYTRRYGDISRLDRILEAEGDTTNRYKASKQADVLMLFHLLTATEFYEILDRLAYPYDDRTIPRTVRYYLERTSHGSTLSKVVHAWVLARTDRRRAWSYFLEALESDIADVQGGTTPEGIHLGAMAGTIDLLQRGFTGLETRDDALGLDPCLPDPLASLRFRLRYRGHPEIEVVITHDSVTVGGTAESATVLPLCVAGRPYPLDPRGCREIPLRRRGT